MMTNTSKHLKHNIIVTIESIELFAHKRQRDARTVDGSIDLSDDKWASQWHDSRNLRGRQQLTTCQQKSVENVKVALVCRSEAGPINHAVGIFRSIQCFDMVTGAERFKRSNWLWWVRRLFCGCCVKLKVCV